MALVSLALALGWLGWKALADPEIPFLSAGRGAEWIVYPSPGDPAMHPTVELGALFRRSFPLASPPRTAELHLRAFKRFELSVNGRPALRGADLASWKRDRRVDIARLLHAGENRIEVLVTNSEGPPALWLQLALPGRSVGSDERWQVSWAGATWAGAARAHEPMRGRRFDPDGRIRPAAAALVARRGTLALLALLSAGLVALGAWWLERRGKRARQALESPWALRIALMIAAVGWAALFVNDDRWLKVLTGFDVTGHVSYLRYLLQKHSLPLPHQGWQMYQPPLYYVLAAAVLASAGLPVPGAGAATALRWLGLTCGVLNLVLVGAALRLVFPGHPRRQLLALTVAAFLPMQLTLYQLPTNEGLVATLSSAVLLTALHVLRRGSSLRLHALLGLCMGLALLAKVSALLVIAVTLGVLVVRLVGRPRRVVLRGLAGIGLAVGIALLVCGWYYGRVWMQFGTPLVGNWEAGGSGFSWWQDSGHRTAQDYLRFGRALSAPFFAGFAGAWDGLYSTLWGDGLCSGSGSIWMAPPWCSDLMSAGYLLALIPTLAILVGAAVFLVRWIARPNLRDAALLGVAFVTFTALVFRTLELPSYGIAKSFYGLGALLPLCAFAAVGFDFAMTRLRGAAAVVLFLLGTWALVSYGAVWVSAGSPRALAFRGQTEIGGGARRKGVALLRQALARNPADWTAREFLVQIMAGQGATRQELRQVLEADGRIEPDVVERHIALGRIAADEGDLDRAAAEAGRAIALAPDLAAGHTLRAVTMEARGDAAGAVAAWREVLRVDPFDAKAHEGLGRLLVQSGAPDSAAVHRTFAARLRAEALWSAPAGQPAGN